MSNEVLVSNTPIFDQLARDLGYERLISGGPTLRLRPAYTGTSTKTEGIRPAGLYFDEIQLGGEQTDDAVDAAPNSSIAEEEPQELHMVPGFWKMSDEE